MCKKNEGKDSLSYNAEQTVHCGEPTYADLLKDLNLLNALYFPNVSTCVIFIVGLFTGFKFIINCYVWGWNCEKLVFSHILQVAGQFILQ